MNWYVTLHSPVPRKQSTTPQEDQPGLSAAPDMELEEGELSYYLDSPSPLESMDRDEDLDLSGLFIEQDSNILDLGPPDEGGLATKGTKSNPTGIRANLNVMKQVEIMIVVVSLPLVCLGTDGNDDAFETQ